MTQETQAIQQCDINVPLQRKCVWGEIMPSMSVHQKHSVHSLLSSVALDNFCWHSSGDKTKGKDDVQQMDYYHYYVNYHFLVYLALQIPVNTCFIPCLQCVEYSVTSFSFHPERRHVNAHNLFWQTVNAGLTNVINFLNRRIIIHCHARIIPIRVIWFCVYLFHVQYSAAQYIVHLQNSM